MGQLPRTELGICKAEALTMHSLKTLGLKSPQFFLSKAGLGSQERVHHLSSSSDQCHHQGAKPPLQQCFMPTAREVMPVLAESWHPSPCGSHLAAQASSQQVPVLYPGSPKRKQHSLCWFLLVETTSSLLRSSTSTQDSSVINL